MLDNKKIKLDFPIFESYPDLAYLDNAATSQKPQVVIDAIGEYYRKYNANIHRGVHHLSDESTQVFEDSKKTVAEFFGAKVNELIITRNATEAINGVAYGWALSNLKKDDLILTTMMEHHANIVPWQEICQKTGCKLEFIKVDENGKLDLADLEAKLKTHGAKIKLITLAHVSNALGTINPIEKIVKLARKNNPQTRILIDGAQSAPHLKIDFTKLGADFYAFSGHKMLGPMGVGGLIVKAGLLKNGEMKPWLFGGGMIDSVATAKTIFNEDLSERFIAGTPDVASIYGLAKACQYLSKIGMKNVEEHDRKLVRYALEKLGEIKELEIVGPKNASDRLGSVTFIYKNVHAHDVAQVLDKENIAVRSGHHCAMPLHTQFDWQATIRASFNVYNDVNDIDKLVTALRGVKTIFS